LIKLDSPILTNEQLERIRGLDNSTFKSVTLPIVFEVSGGSDGLEDALKDLFTKADKAIEEGANLLILSDRGFDREHAPIPSLLASSGLHHHLIRNGKRLKVALILESGEPREVHHFALLIGYGVSAVNPYLAYESIEDMIEQDLLKNIDKKTALKNYKRAL
jgi:glutamate synthase (ferredoxin)